VAERVFCNGIPRCVSELCNRDARASRPPVSAGESAPEQYFRVEAKGRLLTCVAETWALYEAEPLVNEEISEKDNQAYL
jgi:hypothetical protein